MPDIVKYLYPECTSYRDEMLKVSTLHHMYYEECGNSNGMPVVFLHGGPGSGCNPTQRRFFDPLHYRIILLDQRGCGRSTPQGEVRENTTADLVQDINALREHLGIAQWHVFGGSWGSTLAIAYALQYTSQVISLTLRGIFLSRPLELNWFLNKVGLFYPEPWEMLCKFLPGDSGDSPIVAYETLVFSEDKSISIPAAIAWNTFESSIMTLLPRAPIDNETNDGDVKLNGEVELARARVQIHYIQNQCFVGQRDLLGEAAQKLKDIPATIIQGRYDMVCPPQTAWELSRAMPHAELVMVADAGHSAMEVSITSALVAATEKYKAL